MSKESITTTAQGQRYTSRQIRAAASVDLVFTRDGHSGSQPPFIVFECVKLIGDISEALGPIICGPLGQGNNSSLSLALSAFPPSRAAYPLPGEASGACTGSLPPAAPSSASSHSASTPSQSCEVAAKPLSLPTSAASSNFSFPWRPLLAGCPAFCTCWFLLCLMPWSESYHVGKISLHSEDRHSDERQAPRGETSTPSRKEPTSRLCSAWTFGATNLCCCCCCCM